MVKDIVFGCIILLLLLFVGYQQFVKVPVIKEVYKTDTIIQRDTVRLQMQAKIHYKVKYIERYDTIEKKFITDVETDTSAWFACIDTTVGKNIVNTCFYYPDKRFSVIIVSEPDTITKYITIEKPLLKYEQQKNSWYVDALKIGGGIILGFVLGRSK